MDKAHETQTITFSVTKEGDWYLARAEGFSIFTEAQSLDELKRNIKEAVSLHFDDGEHENTICQSNLKSK